MNSKQGVLYQFSFSLNLSVFIQFRLSIVRTRWTHFHCLTPLPIPAYCGGIVRHCWFMVSILLCRKSFVSVSVGFKVLISFSHSKWFLWRFVPCNMSCKMTVIKWHRKGRKVNTGNPKQTSAEPEFHFLNVLSHGQWELRLLNCK